MNFNDTTPMLLTDFYKTVHHMSYKPGMEYLTSFWTPRKSRYEDVDYAVFFGLQGFIKEHLGRRFDELFFNKPWKEIEYQYKRIIANTMSEQASECEHIKALHDLGYLPIEIAALPEGTVSSIRVPMMRITNTTAGYGWLVNYLETYISVNIWQAINSATVGHRYRLIANDAWNKTMSDVMIKSVPPKGCVMTDDLIDVSGTKIIPQTPVSGAVGDFSMRGMGSIESAVRSSAGHLLSFTGTATIGAVCWLEDYYGADCEKETIGRGLPSMEHSVMETYGMGDKEELECYRHLICDVFKDQTFTIVSDTYSYFRVITEVLPALKDEIVSREGKVIVRGDSGDPVDIICGTKRELGGETPEERGTVEILWDTFGGYINELGYKVLSPSIGCVYGDAITWSRAQAVYERLRAKGFCAASAILGAGSYSYQYASRDSLGQAYKATDCVINGEEFAIFKDPVTDKAKGGEAFKKSQKGLVYVYRDEDGKTAYIDELTQEDMASGKYDDNLLQPVYRDGKLLRETTLTEVRKVLNDGAF